MTSFFEQWAYGNIQVSHIYRVYLLFLLSLLWFQTINRIRIRNGPCTVQDTSNDQNIDHHRSGQEDEKSDADEEVIDTYGTEIFCYLRILEEVFRQLLPTRKCLFCKAVFGFSIFVIEEEYRKDDE